MGSKTLSGVFVCYDQRAGRNWSGDYLIADWDEIEQAETSREIHVRRVKEINVCLANGKHRFPLAENLIRQGYPAAKRTRTRNQQLTWEPDESEKAIDDPTSPPADVDEPAGGGSLPPPDA